MKKEKIIIIGGGFAGIHLCKHLDKDLYEICLVDRNNFNSFAPLIYQVASSELASADICFPFRSEFRKRRHISYHIGQVTDIDVAARRITTNNETLEYDKLILAAGSTNNYFGMANLKEDTYGIKTVAEAAHTRDEILDLFERGAICHDKARRRRLLSFLVVGGGPAGVEIAGALGEMKKNIIAKEYPELSPDDITITLVEGSDNLLGSMRPQSGKYALKSLEKLMVNVRLNTLMTDYSNKYVTFADGHKEYYETLIWTAGVCGEPMPGIPMSCIGHGNRIIVDEFNRVIGCEDVYAVGDICLMQTDEYPKGHPQMAQPAMQMAANLAENLNDPHRGKPFRYRDKGSMATIGKAKAVADLPAFSFRGFTAWLAWLAIHLVSILGMRNKLSVLSGWFWNYSFNSTSLRLLLRPAKYPLRKLWSN